MRKRTNTVSARLSDEECDNLNKAIEKCNMTKSAFVRMIANQYLPKERQHRFFQIAELALYLRV